MPKRKRDKHDFDHLERKIRRLERKLKRARQRDHSLSGSASGDVPSPRKTPESESITNGDKLDMEKEPCFANCYSEFDFFEPISGTSPPPQDTWINKTRRQRSLHSVVTAAMPHTINTVADIHLSPSSSPRRPKALLLPHANTTQNINEGDIIGVDAETDPLTTVASTSNSKIELDLDLLKILGEDPTDCKDYGPEIHKDLAIRLNHIAKSGISKDQRKEIKESYLIPSNCKQIKTPSLNPEIRASLSESQNKRDKGIEYKQNMTGWAISSLSSAITMLLNSENKNPELLIPMMDTARILGDIQHSDFMSRRFFILFNIKKEMKDQLEKTKIDEMLFGSNLSETIKSAKTISKSGADIRSASSAKPLTNKSTGKHLNYRLPPANRRRPAAVGASRAPRLPPPPPAHNQRSMTTTTRPAQHSGYRMSSRQPHMRYRR